jgi:N-acetylneuraminic acid mutarotase
LTGNDLGEPVLVESHAECLPACEANLACTHYTYLYFTCYLKQGSPQSIAANPDATSGVCTRPVTTTAAPPPMVDATRSADRVLSMIQQQDLYTHYGCTQTDKMKLTGTATLSVPAGEPTPQANTAKGCVQWCALDVRCTAGFNWSPTTGGRCELKAALFNGASPPLTHSAPDYKMQAVVCTKLPQSIAPAVLPPAVQAGETPPYPGQLTALEWQHQPAPSMPKKLGEVASAIIGRKMIVVGEGADSTLGFDLQTKRWEPTWTRSTRPYPAHHHATVVLGAELYLIGGLEPYSKCVSRLCIGEVQIYNPNTNKWRLGAKLPFRSSGSVAAAVIDEFVYACGGLYTLSSFYHPGNPTDCARYSSTTGERGTWTAVAPMLVGVDHAAAGSDGSKFYIFGGRSNGVNINDAGLDLVQVYDPSTNTWEHGPSKMPLARGGMGAALFVAGRFFLFGGETRMYARDSNAFVDTGVYEQVHVYDPAADIWEEGPAMPTPRHGTWPVVQQAAANSAHTHEVYIAGGGVKTGFSSSDIVEVMKITSSLATAAAEVCAPNAPALDRFQSPVVGTARASLLRPTQHLDMAETAARTATSAEECAAACLRARDCAGAQFYHGTSDKRQCRLLTAPPTGQLLKQKTDKHRLSNCYTRRATGSCSAVNDPAPIKSCVFYQSTTFVGNDLPAPAGGRATAATATGCEVHCLANARCSHFTHSSTDNQCRLKSATAPLNTIAPNTAGSASGVCGTIAVAPIAPAPSTSTIATAAQFKLRPDAWRKSCEELGWKIHSGAAAAGVCGASKKLNTNTDQKCAVASTIKSAARTCQLAGARLCSAVELIQHDAARGTGCHLDNQLVWTRDSCPGGFVVAGGSSVNAKAECQPFNAPAAEPIGVRCCSEVTATTTPDEPAAVPHQLPCEYARYDTGMQSETLCTKNAEFADRCIWTSAGECKARSTATAVAAAANVVTAAMPHSMPTIAKSAWNWMPATLPMSLFEPQGLSHDGSLYVFGGFVNGFDTMTNKAYRLDVATSQWHTLARMDMFGGITHCGQAVDPTTGLIYLVGGIELDAGRQWPDATSTQRTRVYSTADDKWLPTSTIPDLPAERGAGAAVILGRWLHFFGGGTFQGRDFVSDHTDHWAINLDNVAAGWQTLAPLSQGRNHLGGAAVNGKLYAIGGQKLHDEYNGNFDNVEEYCPENDVWTKMAPLPKGLGHITPGVFAYKNEGLFVLGGTNNANDPNVKSLLYFSPVLNTWTEMEALIPFASQVAGIVNGDTIVAQVSNHAYTGKLQTKLL